MILRLIYSKIKQEPFEFKNQQNIEIWEYFKYGISFFDEIDSNVLLNKMKEDKRYILPAMLMIDNSLRDNGND